MRRVGAVIFTLFVASALWVGAPQNFDPPQCMQKCGPRGPNCVASGASCLCTDVLMTCIIYCNLPVGCE